MENQICVHATNTNFVLGMNMVAGSRMYLKSCLRQVGDPGLAKSIKFVFKKLRMVVPLLHSRDLKAQLYDQCSKQ